MNYAVQMRSLRAVFVDNANNRRFYAPLGIRTVATLCQAVSLCLSPSVCVCVCVSVCDYDWADVANAFVLLIFTQTLNTSSNS